MGSNSMPSMMSNASKASDAPVFRPDIEYIESSIVNRYGLPNIKAR